MQIPSEEKADGGEIPGAFRSGSLPLSHEIGLELLGSDLGHRDKPEIGVVRSKGFDFRIPIAGKIESHVRLPGTHPDFTDEDILDLPLAGALNDEGSRGGVGRGGIEGDGPFAISSGLGGLGAATESHFHLRPRRVPAPDEVGLLLLQHHVIADNDRKFQLGPRNQRQ